MNTNHCSQCGELQSPDARFCPRCGKAIAAAAPAAGADPYLGKVIAERYLLTDKIGQGASGTIYRAEHTALKRKMAVKILHPSLSQDEAAVDRFRNEATTVGQIDNDHILQVLDFGRTDDNRLFFAMELLEGETLDAVLRRDGKLPPERALKILTQVTDALHEAHELGYIHRDLRPRNVFLAVRRGQPDFVKLLDFGLAKLTRPEGVTRQTALGMTFGDPRYMSPEQARGDVIDRRSDVFSFGIVAYELLTGSLPFEGHGPFDVLQKVLDNPTPRVADRLPSCPPWLDAVVQKALQKKPEDRFATLRELDECLRSATAPKSPTAQPTQKTAATVPKPAPVTAARVAATPVVTAPAEATPAPSPSRTLVMPTALPAAVAAAAAAVDGAPAVDPASSSTDAVAGVVHTEARTTEAPRPPTNTIVVDEAMRAVAEERSQPGAPTLVDMPAVPVVHDEPTGPQRVTGDDGWFSDRATTSNDEDFEEELPKKRTPMIIGAVAGTISLGVFAMMALWPHPNKTPKPETQTTPAAVAPTKPVVAPIPPTPPTPPTSATTPTPPTPPPIPVAPAAPPAAPSVAAAPTPPTEKPAAVATRPEPAAPEPVAKAPKPEPVTKSAKPEPVAKAPKPEPAAPGEPVHASTTTKSTHGDHSTPSGFKDPFANPSANGGAIDALIKNGRQKLANGDLQQAQAAFTKARDLDGKNAEAFAGLGEVAFEQGDYPTATALLRQALRLSPNRARFLILLGQSYYKLGRAKEAVQEYKKALKVDPTNQEAQRSLELAERKVAQGG